MIPKTEQETWAKYPDYRWTHHTSSILSMQEIKWSLFNTGQSAISDVNINQDLQIVDTDQEYLTNFIFPEEPIIMDKKKVNFCIKQGLVVYTDLAKDHGTLELKMQGIFLMGRFRRFSGIMHVETLGNDVYTIKLRPSLEFYQLHQERCENFYNNRYQWS